MIKELCDTEIQDRIYELLDWEALEFYPVLREDGTKDVLIPFVMNDAVECYIRLADCSFVFEKHIRSENVSQVNFEKTDERSGMIIRSGDGNITTIWYRKAFLHEHCYQYHRIGHAWRDKRGEEQLRRLVNIVCVLHDKVSYLSAAGSNELEKQLSLLIEFQPFCSYSPINESIEEWYPETRRGIEAMIEFANEAGDNEFAVLTKKYLQIYDQPSKAKRIRSQLIKALTEKEHTKLLSALEDKVEEASKIWEKREYSKAFCDKLLLERKKKEEEYKAKGYTGNYPLMYKNNEKVFFAEQLPFTVMEWEGYEFKIIEIFI